MGLTLVIDEIIAEDRTYKYNKILKVTDPNKSEVTNVYFAEKTVKLVDEKDGDYKYTFKSNNNAKTKAEKNEIAGTIRNKANNAIKAQNKKVRSLDDITSKMTKDSYTKGDTITFDIYKTKKKKETSYKKISDASIGNQVYLIAETKELEGKKVKLKIHENEKELKLLKTKDELLPVLVYAKLEDKTGIEATDWISIDIKKEKGKKTGDKIVLGEGSDTIEIGIKKIQMRPKKDKMASKTEEASKSFEGWAEKLYIREDESADGEKSEKQKEEEARAKEIFVPIVKDDSATKVSYPKKISGSKSIEVGKVAEYNLDEYKYKQATEREDDKKNILWSLHIKGDKASKYTVINTKSKANLYTYAKMEIVGGKNKLSIVFDKALKGKKIQIEPYRNKPDIDQSKSGYDYIKTTTIKAEAAAKITELDTTKLWLKTECDDCTKKEKEFLNGSFLKLEAKPLWTNPIDPSEITLYNYSGVYKPKGSSFGKVRLKWNKARTKLVPKSHTGLDIFAEKGTDVFACLDGTIERIYGKTKDGSYGNVIVIEVDYTEYLTKSKNKYSLKFAGEIKEGPKFNLNEKVYLRYAHIQKSLVKAGDVVKSGDKIGLSGVTGNATGTRAPHLHFEIANLPRPGKGLVNRCNPSFYVNLIGENQADKKNQKEVSETSHKS